MTARVLVLIKGLGRGGAERLLATAAPHLDRDRFEYEVAYLLPWKDALAGELRAAGLGVRCLDGARGMGWVARLRRVVRDERIDLVHVHSPAPAIGARLGLDRRVPLVYTEHNVWARYRPATYWGNALTYPRNDRVFAVSDRVRHSIRYPAPLRGRRMPPVETLHHGIDREALVRAASSDGVRAELGIPDGAPLVGTVANLKVHKGHEVLLRAAASLRRAEPDARFVVVGAGPLESRLRRAAGELGLNGSVVFTGVRDDVPRLLRSFDVFVLPSLQEGLPVALLEAMALGTPAVVTAAGGTTEVVEAGRDAVVVPPGDAGAIADGVLALLRDAGMRERLGRAAAERVSAFDIRHAVHRVERAYEELLS